MDQFGMDVNDIQEIASGYRERMRRIALFDPLYELDRMKRTDAADQPIDMKGLGLLTLLFFFEQKLMRNQRVGAKELGAFLQVASGAVYQLDVEGYDDLARSIIQTFRPTTGKKRAYSFFNWETKTPDEVLYSILKANAFDMETNSQYYTLDEDGLELVFATKEFYSEFQLSINQLMLRKQLEKGEFKGALRQINEMRIDVESLQERMIKLQHEIQRNIVSEETFNRYEMLLEDTYYRLHRENEEFEELHQFMKETKERLYYQDFDKKERKTYQLVLQISNQLEEVHAAHTNLLQESIELKNKTLKAAQESLYYVGIDSFNFKQDITSHITSTPLPLEAMKGIVAPFLQIEQKRQWSLLTVFEEQGFADEERERDENDGFFDVGGDTDEIRYADIQREKFKGVMKLLLEQLSDSSTTELADFIEKLRDSGQEKLLEQRFFYDFWIVLHQRAPLFKDKPDEETDEKSAVLDVLVDMLGNRRLEVKEEKGILQVTSRYSIQNMVITLSDGHE